jgi:hypothetical protein
MDQIAGLAELMRAHQPCVVLTRAGVSTEDVGHRALLRFRLRSAYE